MTDNTWCSQGAVAIGAQSSERTTLLRHCLAELGLDPSEFRAAVTEGQSSLGSGNPEVRS